MKDFKLILTFFDDSKMEIFDVKDYSMNDKVLIVNYSNGGTQFCDKDNIKSIYKEYLEDK